MPRPPRPIDDRLFAAHGRGRPAPPLDPLAAYDELARTPAARRRRWPAFVHQAPSDEELAALRRSVQAGLPFGAPDWVDRLGTRLFLDLAIRPRKTGPGPPARH
jgi:hypothetical protein